MKNNRIYFFSCAPYKLVAFFSIMLLSFAGFACNGEDPYVPPDPPPPNGENGENGCTPATCTSLGVECGIHDDTCEGTIDCGGCTGDQNCENGFCVAPQCEPKTCADLGYQCGTHDDGCGTAIDCGGCDDGFTCTNGICECVPQTCGDYGYQCGEHDDGCGETISCGNCSENEICEDGMCEIPPCVPATCDELGFECGSHDDGCEGIVECPPCAQGDCQGGICVDGGTCPAEPMCFDVAPGNPDVTVEVIEGVFPPTLNGGTITNAWYEMEKMEFYPHGFMNPSVVTSVDISSRGNSYGSLEFIGAEWGFSANLDLNVTAHTTIFGSMGQEMNEALSSGACFEIVGNELLGDLLECGGYWIEGVDPPPGFEYEVGENEIKLLLVIPEEGIIAAMPPDFAELAPFIITGPLPILITFVR